MSLVTCRSCERSVSSAAPVCVHCGAALWAPRPEYPAPAFAPGQAPASFTQYPPPPYAPAQAPAAAVAYPYQRPFTMTRADVGEFHAMPVWKLAVMSMCTFGLYELYWCYRNWNRVRERTGQILSPFWRAFFAPFWAFSLFEEVERLTVSRRRQVEWSSGLLAVVFFVLSAIGRLPDPWWLLSFFAWIPLVPVQGTINDLAADRGVQPDATIDAKHIVVMVIGAIFFAFAAFGTFVGV
jgi:hypothetical protein